jgi:DinB superfamily
LELPASRRGFAADRAERNCRGTRPGGIGAGTSCGGGVRAAPGEGFANLPHTPWRLLEHLRIAQWHILEFCRNPKHISPSFPEGYWPAEDAPPDAAAWHRSVATFRADLQAMQALVADPATDLFTPLAHGQGQTILREALLVADHNAYHLRHLVVVRRLLGAWPEA